MDLTTKYLGLDLAHPLMTGASPLVDRLDLVKRLEDAGTSAITMHSLFEEQIAMEQRATIHHMETVAESFAEALSFFPNPEDYNLGPEEYLEQIRRIKAMVDVPVIAADADQSVRVGRRRKHRPAGGVFPVWSRGAGRASRAAGQDEEGEQGRDGETNTGLGGEGARVHG